MEDVLTQSPFHKALVFFHTPATWPTWKVVTLLTVMALLVGLSWALIGGEWLPALVAAIIFLFFSITDGFLLWTLPRRSISYGPWQALTIVLAIPRAAAVVILAFIAALIGVEWAIFALVAVQIAGSAALVWGAIIEPFQLQLTHLSIESDRVSPGTRPIRLLHISDLHVERLTRREESLLALVDQVEIDVILITGDYLNLSYVRDKRAQTELLKLLRMLSAPGGVYAVLGSPPVDERDVVPRLFEDLQIQLLVDEHKSVDLGHGRRLILLGMDCTHYLPLDAQRLARLVSASPDDAPQILMYHAPDLFPEAAELGVDLYLCGHTHGGQVRLPGIGAMITSSQLGRRFQMGLYRDGRTHMYVSRGVGMEGLSAPRVRFLAPPEITLIEIGGKEATEDVLRGLSGS